MAIIDDIKNILAQLDEVQFAYLFGSYAKKIQTKSSDIDIAVFLKKEHNNFDTKLHIHHQLEIKLKKEIDLIVLNNVKNFDLLKDIFNDGVVAKESNDDARVMYELAKEHEILDYKEFKRMLDVA